MKGEELYLVVLHWLIEPCHSDRGQCTRRRRADLRQAHEPSQPRHAAVFVSESGAGRSCRRFEIADEAETEHDRANESDRGGAEPEADTASPADDPGIDTY